MKKAHFLPTTLLVLLTLIFSAQSAFANATDMLNSTTSVSNTYGESMELTFELWDPGSEEIIDYETYGEFQNNGSGDFKYKVTDRKGLAKAAGEGIYPSTSIYKNPVFKKIQASGKLRGIHWDFIDIENHQLAFYKWATAPESPGVKLYYTALALERAGMLKHAIKAYHAVTVHFPKQTGWTYFHTPIYVGKVAMDKIEFLTRTHPELGWKYVDFELEVKNGTDLDINNDAYTIINPGRLIEEKQTEEEHIQDLSKLKIVQSVGSPEHVNLVQYENGHWQLQVGGKPFMSKAIAYEPTPVGQSAHDGTRKDWMQLDENNNGLIDGPYDSWVDADKDNQRDANENVVGDFQLLKEMGVNTFRHYHGASNKQLLREAYEKYGIMSVIGDFMGMYAVGSGADWNEGTDYTNPEHLKTMEESIRKTVMEHKDEPYVLFWMLSNEGNYGFPADPDAPRLQERVGLGSKGKFQYKEMYAFANKMAKMIKELDPNHPVAFSNGEVIFIEEFGRQAPDIDIFGANVYRGKDGFGYSFWNDVKRYTGKAAFITEYGCPSYHNHKSLEEAEELQYEYHKGNWEDIRFNRAGSAAGNAIGGVAYEYIDEWWKAGPSPEFDPFAQETVGDFKANFPDGWMHEEWLGIVSHGNGEGSPYMRQLRKSYHYYKDAWNQDLWNV